MRKIKRLLPGIFLVLILIALSSFRPSQVAAGDCGGPYPPKPAKVWAKSGPSVAEVTVYWEEVSYADRYAIVYGEESGQYVYGATNIGGASSKSYTVKELASGKKYYFRLAAARDCTSSPFSDEVMAYATFAEASVAKAGGVVSSQQIVGKFSSISAVSGPGIGEVSLNWSHREDVDTYHLVYGMASGNYQYGALNIGKVTKFTVGKLVPGRNYYFAIVPVKGDRALYSSEPVMGLAKAPLEQVAVETQNQPVSENEQMMLKQIEDEATGISEDGVRYGADIDADEDESDVQGVYSEDGIRFGADKDPDEESNVQGVYDEGYYDQFSPPEGYYQEDQSELDMPSEVENEGYLTPEE